MLSLVITSLLIIGLVTIWFFTDQNKQYHEERLQRKERAIKTEMTYFSKEVELQEDMDVVIKEFEEEVFRLASVHQLEINVFNTSGEILVAARPDSVHSQYIEKRVPESAISDLVMMNRIIIPEQEGSRKYLSDYTNLYNENDERIAILNIPYLQDTSVNQQDLEAFLGSIGMVYLFIFLGGIGLTFLLSRSITRNLTELGGRMQKVNLNERNEPFDWKSDDEIGKLVNAFNTMLNKLEESRQELAKTERESAWREMARQVAHEIKNPLTPIKLSVQHLQATANYDDEVWCEKFKRTMATIIQQIDSLSNIATEFSDFAKMPQAKAEVISLNQAVLAAAELYADLAFELVTEVPDQTINSFVDPEQLGRVMNNLIKNAKQAVSDTQIPRMRVCLKKVGETAEIIVEDNGSGIADDFKDKIFRPNFTTKSSGMGLGLSICKQIIESAGGSISFESELGIGTTFKVTLPAVKP
ncbi:MAG TPA: hypothetical protein DCR48_14810 [Flavobacteriales bacterium]|nr:hypothetical protein [Flavobacteriales bacterium]